MNRDGSLSTRASPTSPRRDSVIPKTRSASDGMRCVPLNFPCDRFTHWQDNLRAIAIRWRFCGAFDRYGVTQNDEQYSGFKALPPVGPSHDAIQTVEDAERFISPYSARRLNC